MKGDMKSGMEKRRSSAWARCRSWLWAGCRRGCEGGLAKQTIGMCLLTLALAPIGHALTVGDAAPNFSATRLDGRAVSLSDFKGQKPVLIKFWATWCYYCVAEMPHLQNIYHQKSEAVEVLLVNIGMNDSEANIQALFNKQQLDMPVVIDRDGAIVSAYGVVGTPYQLLIDKQGVLAYQTFLMTDELETLLMDL